MSRVFTTRCPKCGAKENLNLKTMPDLSSVSFTSGKSGRKWTLIMVYLQHEMIVIGGLRGIPPILYI